MPDTSANVIAAAWAASAGTIIRPAAMKRIIDAIEPLIRAEEREACARLAEQVGALYVTHELPDYTTSWRRRVPHPFADLIRARTNPTEGTPS